MKKLDLTGRSYWLCSCECGNIVEVNCNQLKQGKTKSCGCYHLEQVSKAHVKHEKRNTKLYSVFASMKQRCYNKNNTRYKHYGGRGIKICDEWLNDFMTFYDWAMNNGYKEGLSIDRIDNNKGYSPNNCHWVTNKENVNNRRNTKYITYKGITKPLADWCDILKINYDTLYSRICKYG